MKKIRLFFVMLVLSVFANFYAVSEAKVPSVKVSMPFSKGLNLAVWLEANYSPDGNVASFSDSNVLRFGKQDFEDIKTLGVEIIRVPVHFQAWSSGKPDYIVSDWVWDFLDKVVAWCSELGMYVIIDYHNNCQGSSQTSPDIEKVLLKIWSQIAKRYKDSGKYVLYEVHNEPHMKSGNLEADVEKWGLIQGNVLKAIRAIDKTHTVIVGAEDWNSVTQLLKLPDYKDSNIIYNFHDYSPFLFTTQGADWCDLGDVKHMPFPYVKEKMPVLPDNVKDWVKNSYNNYEYDASEAVLVKPLNDAVAFANKRKVALMCDEWGVIMDYADSEERANYYRLKAKWMDERNIIRVSWGYREGFGIFKNSSLKPYEAKFPEDLNEDILKAMDFKVPSSALRSHPSWIESAKQKNDFTIYKNGFASNILCDNSWINDGSTTEAKSMLFKKDSSGEPYYIFFDKAKPYGHLDIDFSGDCDFSSFVNNGKSLEFEIRTSQKELTLGVYFMQKEIKNAGKAGLPWRCHKMITGQNVPCDGQWHKVSIPLKEFNDAGAYSNNLQKWFNGEGLFSWKKVNSLVFDIGEKGLQKSLSIRNIEIK